MAVLYQEISSSGISSDDFSDLSESTSNINKQVVIYRQFPDFETNPSVIDGRSTGLPFSAAGNSTAIIRAYNDSGSIYAEQYIEGSGWSHNTLITTGLVGIRPILSLAGGGFDLYLIKSTGIVWKYHSSDGVSWSGSAWSINAFDNTGNLEWIAFGGGGTSLYTMYGVVKTAFGTRNIIAITATTQYDPGIWYPFPFTGFDCQWISAYPDDTSGDIDNTDIRHVLLISSNTAPIIKYKIVDALPVPMTQSTGGLMSCIVRPGEPNRGMNSSPLYPVSITDNLNAQTRVTVHTSTSSSIWGQVSEYDTIWAASYGTNEDINSNDQSYSFSAIWYYCSRDGKHWSQDHMLPMDTISGTIDFTHGCAIIKHGNYLYAVTCEGLVRSPGCLEFNNPGTSDQLDITASVSQYQSSTGDMKQTQLTVENEQGRLNNSLLLSQVALGMVTKFGNESHLFQVSIQEIDQIQPDRERPNQAIQISARDYISRLTDRSEAADAIQWDSPIVGRDTYNNIGGVADSGLAHTSVVQGSFETVNNTLVVKSGYKESIEFYAADKPNLTNGFASSIFTLPNPETHTMGATSSSNPTYAGVIFRAFNKDNFWSVRFNYWTQLIEVVERKKGTNYIWYSQAPSSYFLDRAITEFSVGLRVEFKNARIRVWETTQITSTGSIWSFSFEFIMHGLLTDGDLIQFAGYAGQIGCGYSTSDSASDSTSDTTDAGNLTICGVSSYLLNGTAVIACDGSHIGAGYNIDTSPVWATLSTTGLPSSPGQILQILPDPRGSFWLNGSGAASMYALCAGGLYKIDDISDCSASWSLVQGLTNLTYGSMRINHSNGAVYVFWRRFDVGITRYLDRIYTGASYHLAFSGEHADHGDDFANSLDIDNGSLDEAIICTNNPDLGGFKLIRVLNGSPTTLATIDEYASPDFARPCLVQKPLTKQDGSPNNTADANELIVLCNYFDANYHNQVMTFTNNGATVTRKYTSSYESPSKYMSSVVSPTNINAALWSAFHPNQKVFFTRNFTSSTPTWSQLSGATSTNCDITSGFYPEANADGSYQTYFGGSTDMAYAKDWSSSLRSILGNWVYLFGDTGSGFRTVIPLKKL